MPRQAQNRRNTRESSVRRAAGCACEQLEKRTLLSTIVWSNRGTASNDSDGFNAMFGGNAQQARLVCDRAILDWEEVIANFNYNGGGNTFNVTIRGENISSIASGQVTAQNNGKPTAGLIRLDSVGTTHWVDPSAGDDAEFTDNITNAYTGYAITNPIVGVDLYATMVHELGHVLGISNATGLSILNFITDTMIDDPSDSAPGNLLAFNVNGGPVEAVFTAADPGHLWEGPGNTQTNNAGLPWHPDHLMNPGRAIAANERNLISDTEALILRDAYGYTINLPSTINNMLVNSNFTTDALRVVGQPGSANDLIIVQGTAVPGQLHVTVGTVGGGPQYTEIVPLSQTNTITVNAGAGNDIIRLEYNGGKATTFIGGLGNDFFDFAFATRNLGNITGPTTVQGGDGDDSIFAYDNANANLDSYLINTIGFNRTGFIGFGHQTDTEHLTLTTGTNHNSVNIPLLNATPKIYLKSAGGQDLVNIGGGPAGVSGIHGDIEVQNDPSFTTINISAGTNNTPRNATINQLNPQFGYLQGFAPGTIFWDNADTQEIHVTTGGGDDTLNVLACSERLYLKSDGGEDNITIGNNAAGLTAVTGAVNVGPNSPFVFSNLTLNDSGNTVGRTSVWTVNGNGFFINGLLPQQFRYENVLQLNVRGGSGADHYALGGIFDDHISIDGGTGGAIDSLAVDDRAFPGTLAYADIGPNFMTRGTGGIFNTTYSVLYSGIESPLFYAQDSATTVNLYGTPSSIPAGQQMTVFCGAGSDTINLYIRDAQGGLTVNGTLGVSGGNGTDSLVIADGGSSGVNYQFLNLFGAGTTNINGLGSALFGAGSNVENITVSAGSGDDTIDIHSFKSGSALRLNGNDGSDSVNWTPSSRDTAPNVTAMAFFSFDGGDGHDYLNFFNDNNPSSWNYTRTNANFSASRTSGGAYFVQLNDPNVETLYATGGAGGDDIFIQQVRPGGEVFIDGKGGSDEFFVGNAQRTQDIRGLVGIYTSLGNDGITIDDTADTVGRTFHIDASTVGAAPGDDLFGPGGRLEFAGVEWSLEVQCGSGNDTAYVLPHPVTPIVIELNGQSGRGTGDELGLAFADAINPVFVPDVPGSGFYFFDNRAPVAFASAESTQIDDVAPQVLGSSFELDAPQQAISMSFSEDVSSSLTSGSITLQNLTTNQTISSADIAISYDMAANVATFTFPNFTNAVLPDGNYKLTVDAGDITDLFGNGNQTEHALDFFFLQGDANHDRRVNLADFNILAINFGQGGRVFSQADFNYDGQVNLQDFNILATAFGNVLDEPTARAAGGELTRTPFSRIQIDQVAKTRHAQRLVDRLNEVLA
jgi:hypothetical protein